MDKLKFNTNNYDNLFSGRASWLDSNLDFFKESDEPEFTQEGMFDVGFGNLRLKLANALKDKFTVSNVVKGMNGKNQFTITGTIDGIGDIQTVVSSTGTGCEVISRSSDGRFKRNFNNISLQPAFEKIKALFEQPNLLFSESYNIFKESDEPDDELDTDIDDVHSDLEDDSDDENPDTEVEETETEETEETSDDGDNEDVEIEQPQLVFNCQYVQSTYVDDLAARYVRQFAVFGNSMNFNSGAGDAPKPTEGPDDYDLQDFGNHGGPDVPNNQYNEKDVEILNKLISSESDAINDYFDATTNTVDTNLSRLYGDIGREERFHLEQLMYAKSLITGEKYEPKDPEVKAEYDKLIGDGMDEDTAIITTMDKISIEKPMDDEEFEDLKEDVAQTESYLIQSEMFTEMMLDTAVYSKLVQEYATEMNIYMEDVLNTNTLPKREKYGVNPIRWMIEQFWKFIKFLRKLGKLIREHLARSRAKRNKIKAYISKYGIGAIFQKGYAFYTYNDHLGRFTLEDMIKTSDLLYRTTMIIAHNCGLRINAQSPLAADSYGLKPLPVNSAEQGEKFINGMLLTKSRLNIVDNNEEYIINTLFGFSNGDKLNRYTKDVDANGNEVINHDKLSNNFYNAALVTLDHITIAAQYAGEVAKEIENLEGVPDSIYRRNYETWKKSVDQMKSVMKGFQRIINAMNHDINTMLKIDEYVIQLTNEHDAAQQSGQPYNGETRYANAAMNQPQQNQNNNQKKLVSRFA